MQRWHFPASGWLSRQPVWPLTFIKSKANASKRIAPVKDNQINLSPSGASCFNTHMVVDANPFHRVYIFFVNFKFVDAFGGTHVMVVPLGRVPAGGEGGRDRERVC